MFERFVGSGWGSLELELNPGPHNFGETIEGWLALSANRTMGPGRLSVELACVERQSRIMPAPRRFPSFSHQSRSKVLWRSETVVDEAVTLEEGASSSHPWSVGAPLDPAEPQHREDIPEWATGTIAVIDALTFADRGIVWEVRARFRHADGFTLRHNVRVDLV